ncbi:SMEK domain-containing protein [Salinarimonas soli]|uniref:SMEK domain-containing protein n=1 Tax=Salinarimonas soli TaxID=1638099 RepID=A0A5B2VB18_9HYPH|nr:SMEK domain-containing protein [Salinarimonas soli]KAA2235976.1 SMEK domain-containing protein [Salinarimonas soli]
MRQLEVENQLRDVVSRIVVQVELATSQGRTDMNLALEDAFIPILKSVYNLPHLVNLNRKQKNFPGIDLGDDHDRVAFQVTSTTTLEKVKSTVRQFMDRAYYNTFDELFILMFSRKQSSYSQASVNELLTDQFAFNCKKHIIDLSDLLGQVSGLRLAAQERVLSEFQRILGEVDAHVSFSSEGIAAPSAITSNLQQIRLPEAVYVAELTIDDKAVIAKAKAELSYKGMARGRKSVVKMALLLNSVETDAWVCYDNKLFSFHDIERCGLISVVDRGSVERLEVSDLAGSPELDNVNILKQLLSAQTRERLKQHRVRMHAKEGFFFFGPTSEGQLERKETWVGKKTAIRRVYEVRHQRKDPSKVAHHQHLSFDLTFTKLGDAWYAQIVPGWFYSYNGYVKSNWHDDLLSQQKRLEHNSSVRNTVRFIAYFLSSATKGDDKDDGLRFLSLVEFDAREIDEAEPDDDEDLTRLAEGSAA